MPPPHSTNNVSELLPRRATAALTTRMAHPPTHTPQPFTSTHPLSHEVEVDLVGRFVVKRVPELLEHSVEGRLLSLGYAHARKNLSHLPRGRTGRVRRGRALAIPLLITITRRVRARLLLTHLPAVVAIVEHRQVPVRLQRGKELM